MAVFACESADDGALGGMVLDLGETLRDGECAAVDHPRGRALVRVRDGVVEVHHKALHTPFAYRWGGCASKLHLRVLP